MSRLPGPVPSPAYRPGYAHLCALGPRLIIDHGVASSGSGVNSGLAPSSAPSQAGKVMYKGEHRRKAGRHAVARGRYRPHIRERHLAMIMALGLLAVPSLSGASPVAAASQATIETPSGAVLDVAYTSLPVHYTVRHGDTLSALSRYFCHTSADYPAIAAASGIADPNRIYVGQRLTIRCGRVAVRAGHAIRAAVFRGTGYHTHYGYYGLKALWRGAGGPSWAAPRAARIAICESGGYIYAHNASGASGLWQILGLPFAGNVYNPFTNARMAVAKFRGAGNSFAPWVCRG